MKNLYIKRVKKWSRRWFFDNPTFNRGDGEMVLVFVGVFGIEIYYASAKAVSHSHYFYVDLPSFVSFFVRKINVVYKVKDMPFKAVVPACNNFENLL